MKVREPHDHDRPAERILSRRAFVTLLGRACSAVFVGTSFGALSPDPFRETSALQDIRNAAKLTPANSDLLRLDPEFYQSLQRRWDTLLHSPQRYELTVAHHLLYQAVLGKDWRKGFQPITNSLKLDNGGFTGWTLFRAVASLHMPSREAELLAPFDGLVTPTMLQEIREQIPILDAYQYRSEQFADRRFPFEAYRAT